MLDLATKLKPFDLWDRFKQWRLLRRNVHAVLRLLYLECLKNVELLKCLNLGNRKARQDDPDFFAVIPQLETSVLELIFLEGERNAKIFKILSERIKVVRDDNRRDEPRDETHLIHATIFVYLKINVLQRLAAIRQVDGERTPGTGLKRIQYKTRLTNIRQNLDEIVKVLEQQKEFRRIQMRKVVGY